MDFVKFMSSRNGRLLRGVVGAILLLLALLVVGGTWGWILLILGVVFVAVAVFNVCLLAPLFGGSLKGE